MTGRLDIELLEAFVAIVDTGSFTRAGVRLHRTQPAVSMQMKRLEERVGKTLLRRKTRSLELTGSGEALFSYAKNIVELSREASYRISMPELSGVARVGIPEWFATDQLQAVLCHFARVHPDVKLEMHVGDSVKLRDMITADQLDLALAICDPDQNPPPRIWREPLYWAAATDFSNVTPVPLVLFIPPCPYREVAADALASVDREWREVFTSMSVAAVRVALLSGLGVSVLPAGAITAGLKVLRPEDGFPELPPTELALYTTGREMSHMIRFLYEYLSNHVGEAILNNTNNMDLGFQRRQNSSTSIVA